MAIVFLVIDTEIEFENCSDSKKWDSLLFDGTVNTERLGFSLSCYYQYLQM